MAELILLLKYLDNCSPEVSKLARFDRRGPAPIYLKLTKISKLMFVPPITARGVLGPLIVRGPAPRLPQIDKKIKVDVFGQYNSQRCSKAPGSDLAELIVLLKELDNCSPEVSKLARFDRRGPAPIYLKLTENSKLMFLANITPRGVLGSLAVIWQS